MKQIRWHNIEGYKVFHTVPLWAKIIMWFLFITNLFFAIAFGVRQIEVNQLKAQGIQELKSEVNKLTKVNDEMEKQIKWLKDDVEYYKQMYSKTFEELNKR